MNLTILDDHNETVVESHSGPGDGPWITPAAVASALGWVRKPEGWCRGDVCIPSFAAARAEHDGHVDLTAFAELIGRPHAAEPAASVFVLGASVAQRRQALDGGEAPDFTLLDIEGTPHSLSDLRGRKVALVFWASWCGCRYDLPEWQRQHATLADQGFSVMSIAIDRRAEDARPWIDAAAVTHPAVIDTDARVADLYQVLNVPTIVWIDEEGRIARPNDTQFATDLFRSMSGLDSSRSLAALRRWVSEGDAGLTKEEVENHTPQVTAEQQQARTESALGLWLYRRGHEAAAKRHFVVAGELAPQDVTIWRGVMPLLGVDPMGDEYFARRQAMTDAGIPIYRPLPDWQDEAAGQ